MLYEIVADGGGIISSETSGKVVCCADRAVVDTTPIVAFVTDAKPGVVFLISAGEQTPPLVFEHEDCARAALSFNLVVGEGNRLHLRHPLRMSYLSASTVTGASTPVSCRNSNTDEWETFTLRMMDTQNLTFATVAIVRGIERAFAPPQTVETIARWLTNEPKVIRDYAGLAVCRVLPLPVLHELAGRVLSDASLADAVIGIASDDIWPSDILPKLLAWTRDREQVSSVEIGLDYDFLALSFAERRGVLSFAAYLTSLIRSHVLPQKDLSIVASARNEGPYLLEWIAHHKAIGVQHFFLYSNYNTDDSDALLQALADEKVITWIRNSYGPGIKNLLKAYAHALSCLPNTLDYKWTLIIDLDEFVILDKSKYTSLVELIQEREATGANVISLSWRMFTVGGQARWKNEPLIKRNLFNSGQDNEEVKSLCLTRFFAYSWPHDPTATFGVPVTYQNAIGGLHHWAGKAGILAHGTPIYQNAWVHHYYFKSIDELMWKAARKREDDHLHQGYAFDTELLIEQSEALASSTDHPDQAGLVHLDGLELELARLRASARVTAAEARVISSFSAHLGALRSALGKRLRLEIKNAQRSEDRTKASRALSVLSSKC